MSDQPSSRDIVYDFAEILSQINMPIKDERLLPHPKAAIRDAFLLYMRELETRAQFLPDAGEELGQVQSVYMHLSDFQKIDREDMALVSEINTGRRFERFRTREGLASPIDSPEDEQALKEFTDMTSKYMMRGIVEFGP